MDKALIVPVEGPCVVVPYDHRKGYDTLSTAVGGYIECLTVGIHTIDDMAVHVYLNEEGKLHALPVNHRISTLCWEAGALSTLDVAVGTAIIISAWMDKDGYDFGLTLNEIVAITDQYGWEFERRDGDD